MNARTKAGACIILAAALWGVIGVFFNLLSGLGFTQMQVVAIRSATAAAALKNTVRLFFAFCISPDANFLRTLSLIYPSGFTESI